MLTIGLTLAVFLLAVAAMAVGVIASGRAFRGSCGGPGCSCANEGRPIGSCESDSRTDMAAEDTVR